LFASWKPVMLKYCKPIYGTTVEVYIWWSYHGSNDDVRISGLLLVASPRLAACNSRWWQGMLLLFYPWWSWLSDGQKDGYGHLVLSLLPPEPDASCRQKKRRRNRNKCYMEGSTSSPNKEKNVYSNTTADNSKMFLMCVLDLF